MVSKANSHFMTTFNELGCGRDVVYLDYAATAPLFDEACEVLKEYIDDDANTFMVDANANSLYTPGRMSFSRLEYARKVIAENINAKRPDEIVFTSGATEANSSALLGIAKAAVNVRKRKGIKLNSPKIITSRIEHDSVLLPMKTLLSEGFEVSYLQPDKDGFVSVEKLNAEINSETVLVSIQMANSEIGSIQNVSELCKIAHSNNSYFHTDATQALGKIRINLQELDVDAASFSGHKVGSPKGIGFLYLKADVPYVPLLMGGGQENNKRSGTQNVLGACAMAACVDYVCKMQNSEAVRLSEMRDILCKNLPKIKGVRLTVNPCSNPKSYLPNIVNIIVEGYESETLILKMDELGFCISGGSACSSASLDPSHVLIAIGKNKDEAYGELRISFGRYTTKKDILAFIDAFDSIV